MYKVYLETIQTYAQCNSYRFTVDSTAEEDSYHDILLLMELLFNLLSRDIMDDIEKDTNVSDICAFAKFFFSCLKIIMPLIRIDLLKFPSLCLE